MATARDVMTPGPRCVGEQQSVLDAARLLEELDVGAMPIRGEDHRLKGMLTDRDIFVKCLAFGSDPATTRVGDLRRDRLVTVDVDDSLEDALEKMRIHRVRRLPVIDGHDLVGIVTWTDITRMLPLATVVATT